MNLLQFDPTTVKGTYVAAAGEAHGAPHFINLDNIVWGYVDRADFALVLTMVTGGTWKLEYTDRAEYHRVSRLFTDNAFDPKDR